MKTGRPNVRELVLSGLPGTRSQIERKSGVSSSSVGKWLAILRGESAVHVGGWRRSKHGSKKPIFFAGAGEDKPEPKTLTPEQSQKRFRRRHPERVKEIRHNSYRRCLMREKGHGWLSALVMTRGAA